MERLAEVKVHTIYNEKLVLQLRNKTRELGDFHFDDDIWYCKHKHIDNRQSAVYNLVFSNLPVKYKMLLKYFVLLRSNLSMGTLKGKISGIAFFLRFLETFFKETSLVDVNRKIINKYEEYLLNKGQARRLYYAAHDFFSTLVSFPGMPLVIPSKNRNPFKIVFKNNDDRYIPEEVIEKWDLLMKNNDIDIPLELRTVYWMLRSFPNRINEVLSMKYNCLKPMYDNYVISVPTTKQNGGYLRPEIKVLPVQYHGHGKYVIELIREYKVQRDVYLKTTPLKEAFRKDYLFLNSSWRFVEEYSEYVGIEELGNSLDISYKKLTEWFNKLEDNDIHYIRKNSRGKRIFSKSDAKIAAYLLEKGKRVSFNSKLFDELIHNLELRSKADSKFIPKPDKLAVFREVFGKGYIRPLTESIVNKSFKKIAQFYNIKDQKGEIYSLSTHQFRHNAITDRLYLGFTMEQVMVQSNHKGETMPKQYMHYVKGKHKEILEDIHKLKNPEECSVEFKGRIMNFEDKIVERQLLSNQRAFLTWEANGKKGVGICSDIMGCNPKGTSVYHECYACDWFVPKAEYLVDYKRELEYWENIVESSIDKPNRAAHMENGLRNIVLTERIIKICEFGIEKYKKEMKNTLQGKVSRNEIQPNIAKETRGN